MQSVTGPLLRLESLAPRPGETDSEATTAKVTKGNEEHEKLLAKQNTSAPVWKHFGFEADVMGKPWRLECLQCHVCHQEVIYNIYIYSAKNGITHNSIRTIST